MTKMPRAHDVLKGKQPRAAELSIVSMRLKECLQLPQCVDSGIGISRTNRAMLHDSL